MTQEQRVALFYRPDNKKAVLWAKKIKSRLASRRPAINLTDSNPKIVIVLGGDGTILEAARRYERFRPIIVGLNLGKVGFLASVRDTKQFLPSIKKFFDGRYHIAERSMLKALVKRRGKTVFETNALNEMVLQNPLGMVEAEVEIEGYPMQFIRGSGVLVSTSTGSTAYNLSAHGPIVTPDIKCFIVTELLDHNVPTPSLVIKDTKEIKLKVLWFRKRGLLAMRRNNTDADTLLIGDGESIFPLAQGDVVAIKKSPHTIKFAELDPHYFFKSLQEKFAFR